MGEYSTTNTPYAASQPKAVCIYIYGSRIY